MIKFALAVILALPLAAQDAKPFLGRWDITVTPATGTPYPQWLEVVEKDGKIEGRIQPRGGGWRTFTGATVQNNHLIVPVAPARGCDYVGPRDRGQGPDRYREARRRRRTQAGRRPRA